MTSEPPDHLGGVLIDQTPRDFVRIDDGLRGIVRQNASRFVVPLTDALTLDAYALWTDYAAGAASGFESRQAGLRLRYQF